MVRVKLEWTTLTAGEPQCLSVHNSVGFFSQLASSRSFLGATLKCRWPMKERVTWERKKRERESMFSEFSCVPDSMLGFYIHSLC